MGRHNELNEAKLIMSECMSEESYYSWIRSRRFHSLNPTGTHTEHHSYSRTREGKYWELLTYLFSRDTDSKERLRFPTNMTERYEAGWGRGADRKLCFLHTVDLPVSDGHVLLL